MSDMLRITGMVTGMDTDQMVKDMLKADRIRVDRVKQQKQYVEWQQEAYRDIINKIRSFKDEYFDYLNSNTNFRSPATFNSNIANLANDTLSQYVNITPGSDTAQGGYTISNITTAKAARVAGTANVTADITGGSITPNGNAVAAGNPITIDSSNDTFILDLNGSAQMIKITQGDYTNLTEFRDEIKNRISDAFGSGKIDVSLTGASADQLLFTTDTTNNMRLVKANDALSTMGFSEVSISNKIDLDTNIDNQADRFSTPLSVAGTDNDISFTINNQTFTYTSSVTSLQEIIDDVNQSDAGVTLRYDELSDQFIAESKNVGYSSEVAIEDSSGNLMGALGLETLDAGNLSPVHGSDASLTYDDGSGAKTITRPDNDFTINGMQIELNKDYSAGDINFSVESNADGVVEKITGFVEKYNELIDEINGKISEKKYYDFKPLTDDQKEDMSEEEIKQWEEKAKSGILKNDTNLSSMVNEMRSALYESVEGVGINLYEIGITTSSDYSEKGKLIIDEDKLKAAIDKNPDEVADLFTSNGDTYESKGIVNRFYDIIQENVRTTRNEAGYKGVLIEKAGIEGDITQYDNFFTDRMDNYDDRIADMLDDISRKEDDYYNMFARMESAINQMNNQSSWLMNQMGTGGGQ